MCRNVEVVYMYMYTYIWYMYASLKFVMSLVMNYVLKLLIGLLV